MSYLSDHNAHVIANRSDDPPDEDYCDRDDCELAAENARLDALNSKLRKEIKQLKIQLETKTRPCVDCIGTRVAESRRELLATMNSFASPAPQPSLSELMNGITSDQKLAQAAADRIAYVDEISEKVKNELKEGQG